MAKSYYSTIFEETADQVWAAVGDFGRYEWAEGVGPVTIEGGTAPDANAPGAIRRRVEFRPPFDEGAVAVDDGCHAKSLEKLRRDFATPARSRHGMGADAADIRLG